MLRQLKIPKLRAVIIGGSLTPVLFVKMHNFFKLFIVVHFDVDVVVAEDKVRFRLVFAQLIGKLVELTEFALEFGFLKIVKPLLSYDPLGLRAE